MFSDYQIKSPVIKCRKQSGYVASTAKSKRAGWNSTVSLRVSYPWEATSLKFSCGPRLQGLFGVKIARLGYDLWRQLAMKMVPSSLTQRPFSSSTLDQTMVVIDN